MFSYLPTPEILNWIAKGRLADRQLRAVRLWVILNLLYGESAQAELIPQPFRYADVRDRLFCSTHNNSETANCEVLSADCKDSCLCQKTVTDLLNSSSALTTSWQQSFIALTDQSPQQVALFRRSRPFFTVHRSIRDDLAHLADMGWIVNKGQGRFHLVHVQHWPVLPESQTAAMEGLSVAQTWEVLRSLRSIAFLKPNLEVIIQSLWDQLTSQTSSTLPRLLEEPTQRIFLHLDYILSETMQEHVDTLQEQIERLWSEDVGIVQFEYESKSGSSVLTTVYPVCLHYVRRAKYLSAFGQDPQGNFGWHNYRLDRILSARMTLLGWQHPQVPSKLKAMYKLGMLPTVKNVSDAIDQAWGFNFYLPRELLIMRFPPDFAKRYVQDTERHHTFKSIAYSAIPTLVKESVSDTDEQAAILKTLKAKNEKDKYYRAWIRLGDINIVMRLRDWRPKGEVIAPIALRQLMHEEAEQEYRHYSSD